VQERGGVIISVIANVNGVAANTMTMGMVAIERDTIAVVSARGTVDSYGLITSGAGKGPATSNDAHCLRLGTINDDNDCCSRRHPPPLCCVSCHPRPCALAADVDIAATIQDNVPPSKIVVSIANAKDGEEDGEEGGERRVEGGGHCDCSREERVTSPHDNVFCNTNHRRNHGGGSSSSTRSTATTTTATTTTKVTDGGRTKEDHKDDDTRGEEEDEATPAAPPEGKRRRRDTKEDSYSRRSPSDGPLSYDNGSKDDDDHDH
jgi:hypothetical protein